MATLSTLAGQTINSKFKGFESSLVKSRPRSRGILKSRRQR